MAITAFFLKIQHAAARRPFLTATLILAVGFGAWQSFRANAGEWDSPLALLLLTVGMMGQGLLRLPEPASPNAPGAWFFLMAALGTMALSLYGDSAWGKNSALMLGCAGVTVFSGGRRGLRQLAVPLALCFGVLPFLEPITLWISYPLRLICTGLTVEVLQGFGGTLSSHLTTIYAGNTPIAITDACSGVSQLGVLLFFTWLLAFRWPDPVWYHRAAWVIFILPIVIVANTIRLLLTIGLFFTIGDRVFQDDIHNALGYVFILLSLAMLWGCGKMLFDRSPCDE